METPLEYAGRRFSKFALDVIQPAVWRSAPAWPLRAEAAQFPRAIPPSEAIGVAFHPVDLGWHWGPAWSTCWFRVSGDLSEPRAFSQSHQNSPLALRFSSGTEATLWIDGVPHAGFDRNRDACMLDARLLTHPSVNWHIEAACNHPFGTSTFWWDPAAERERWNSSTPGVLERCEIAAFDPIVWRLWRLFEFARLLLAELVKNQAMDSPRAHELCAALTEAYRCVPDDNVAAAAPHAVMLLEHALNTGAAPSATRCIAVGHAHIDTAWLWPIRETRRKCIRSWANTLRLMERFPGFNFICSQAQQYAWVEEDSPELFRQIVQRVNDGRWEPIGSMWIEPDCSCPSGESLVRQILHGVRWWRSRFGERAAQRILYLPDTFGFPASLPQIMRLAGIDTFITNKLSWNERNEFPFVTFRWRGLDGSEVLSHCTPGHDYNASNTPLELRRGEANCARKDRSQTSLWLQPFGFGDGGGGPTDWQIQNALDARDCEGLPHTALDTTGRFCKELHERAAHLRARGDELPVWDGELYLELHRGTFTSQAFIKRANRRAEQRLRIAEWLTFAGPSRPNTEQALEAMTQLDDAWKITLLNQFHDILPGSSIAAVYEDARNDHARVQAIAAHLIARGVARWTLAVDASTNGGRVTVFNPTSHAASGVVEADGAFAFASVPAMGVASVPRNAARMSPPARIDGRTLSNGILSATIDDAGRVASLRLFPGEREACATHLDSARQPLNQLVLYEDRPRSWEAWDIDADYALKPHLIDSPADRIDVVVNQPLRAAIEVERSLGEHSRVTQRYVLDTCSPRLDVHTRIDWREDSRLLRALFPVDVLARVATYDIQFGHIQRPTTRNNSVEQAMFEVCAHHWMDLSEHGFGVAILNESKYGHSCHANVMGLTLLRSPKWPDSSCDMGVHEFTYSIMPHAGDWREAGVDHQAALLNAPLMAFDGASSAPMRDWAPLAISGAGAAGVAIAALKRAEDAKDDRLILRLVETHGGACDLRIDWNLPVRNVATVNLLEHPVRGGNVHHDADNRRTVLAVRPFEILTLAITLDR